jgi:hypothetical protein
VTPDAPRRDPERRLPQDILALADWRGGEAAWRRKDLPLLAAAAAGLGFACLGGQVQIRLPDATAELYWQDFDPVERRPAEDWETYVRRSWSEALFLADSLPSDEALIGAARSAFEALAQRTDAELADGLWFVTYLAAAPMAGA